MACILLNLSPMKCHLITVFAKPIGYANRKKLKTYQRGIVWKNVKFLISSKFYKKKKSNHRVSFIILFKYQNGIIRENNSKVIIARWNIERHVFPMNSSQFWESYGCGQYLSVLTKRKKRDTHRPEYDLQCGQSDAEADRQRRELLHFAQLQADRGFQQPTV